MNLERMETATLAAELRDLERKRLQSSLEGHDSARRHDLRAEIMARLKQNFSGSERRKFLRIPADLEARFRLGDATITCFAAELSMGGLSLRGHLWVSEDQELLLENLKAGNRDYPMAVQAKVVWKVSEDDELPRAGLQFIDLDAQGKHQVQAVFEQLFLIYLDRLAEGESV